MISNLIRDKASHAISVEGETIVRERRNRWNRRNGGTESTRRRTAGTGLSSPPNTRVPGAPLSRSCCLFPFALSPKGAEQYNRAE